MKSNKVKLKIKSGDLVRIIAGNEKGNSGKVLSINSSTMRVVVEGINMVKRHTKPSASSPEGGIIEKEGSIHISNVALLDGDSISKVGRRVEGNTIVRYFKKSKKTI